MEYDYNCSYFRYNNITPPNVQQQLEGKILVCFINYHKDVKMSIDI